MIPSTVVSKEIAKAFSATFDKELTADFFQIENTKTDFQGDLTLVVFPLLKFTKKSPEQSADLIGKWLLENSAVVSNYNVIKGFLNLSLKTSFWMNQFNSFLQKKNMGLDTAFSGKTYLVEYSSPNTNKPLHLGHLRNNFLGFSVAEILKANGHKVIKTQIINDRGIHICKSMIAWIKFGNGETPESSNLKGDHLIGKYYVAFDREYKSQTNKLIQQGFSKEEAEKKAPILLEAQELLLKWEKKDLETYALWEKMNSWVYDGFNQTYELMGVDFDKLYYESDTFLLGKDVVYKGLDDGIFYKKKDGSIWCDLSKENLDDKLLLRADGTSVYMTQDLGTAIERQKDFRTVSGMIYTVGNEQNHHFKVLFTILKKLGFQWAKECHHLSYGMVELPDGKMKSREGRVVDADDLIQSVVEDAKKMTSERGHLEGMSELEKEKLYSTIGKGGLKYFLLRVDPKRKMMFNPAESIDLNGNTGPFIQYCYARIQSILSNQRPTTNQVSVNLSICKAELDIIKWMLSYPSVIKEAGDQLSPSIVANYTYQLVKYFNTFYQSISILSEKDNELKKFRILLSRSVGDLIKNSMQLLGINVPKVM